MTTIHRALALLPTLAGALTLAACMDCSQAGCGSQLTIDVDLAPTDTVRLEVCRADVCYGPSELGTSMVTMAYTDDLYMQAYLSDAGGGVTGVRVLADEYDDRMSLDNPPADVAWTVRVFNGTQLVVEEAFTPDYAVSYPNGEACGPTCFSASRSFTAL
ncbi:MAG: hypothetical protein KC619_33420 [Myxococcales bacterium]|nr:hypothetical protein [Myxococcales bacterium]